AWERESESNANPADVAEPLCDAERHERHYHAERGNENLSRTSIQLMSQNRRVTQSVTKGISVSKNATKRGTVAPKNGTLARPGTRDTSCNHSYRAAREPFYG
ncbi:hypothetical protein QPL90_18635, partial [Pseudomonas syringae pv. syringae]